MNDSPVTSCPICGKRGRWQETRWRPFCSERCRLIDLGQWFGGNYRISEPLRPEHFAESEKLPEVRDVDEPAD